MADTSIEWTERTWNPIVGCSLVSPGCTNCYAMGIADRFKDVYRGRKWAGAPAEAMTRRVNGKAVWTGHLTLAPDHVLLAPLRRRKPSTYFVNSMGDLFHESVPDEWIDRVFDTIARAPWHTFQILTKRSARMRDYVNGVDVGKWQAFWRERTVYREGIPQLGVAPSEPAWPLPNVWLGVSAEDQKRADERILDLLATPAVIRFVSNEPALGPVDYTRLQLAYGRWLNALTGELWTPGHAGENSFTTRGPKLDWIIVGGESGPGARPMHPDWARQIRDACAAAGTAFFFKQWGEWAPCQIASEEAEDLELRNRYDAISEQQFTRVGKKAAGRLLDGVEHNTMPEVAR